MDGLSGLLDGPRARQAFLLRVVMEPPWALRIEDEAPLSLVVLTSGAAVYRPDSGPAVDLDVGDVVLLRGPDPYVFADAVQTEPRVLIGPDQVCVDLDGALVEQSMALGVRTWGNTRAGSTTLLVGTWHSESEVGRPLLSALPAAVVRRRGAWDDALVGVLAAESAREAPGQSAVLDRLLDLLLVQVVRSWLGDRDTATRGLAHEDPVVGHVLRLVHEAPDRPWTLAALARAAGTSRAVLARRFHEQVGEPPIGYLTRWRLALAADLLAGTDAGLEQVAREVGYGSPFALSAAFKRHHGCSPRDYRRSRQVDIGVRAVGAGN